MNKLNYVFFNSNDSDDHEIFDSLESAVEAALTHDGYAYSFEKQEDGGFTLFASNKHIGNNPFDSSSKHAIEIAWSLDRDENTAWSNVCEQLYNEDRYCHLAYMLILPLNEFMELHSAIANED
jgi:hypothetical protein